jgi:hypothetical protein
LQLTIEMLELVHGGARPVPLRDHRRYFDLVAAELRKVSPLSNAAVLDAIRGAQRELLRPSAAA